MKSAGGFLNAKNTFEIMAMHRKGGLCPVLYRTWCILSLNEAPIYEADLPVLLRKQ